MKKLLQYLFIISVAFFLASAGLIFTESKLQSAGENDVEQKNNERKIKYAVVDYLESSTLEPNCGGKVFADYHKFGKQGNKLYIWAYVIEYYIKNDKLENGSGRSGPMIIILSEDGSIRDHWEPRPGKDYAKSINDSFSKRYVDEVLNFQAKHEDILDELKDVVRKRARQAKSTGRLKFDLILKPGEVKMIELKANRTTGFKWFYTIDNKQVVEVVSDKYRQYEHQEKVLGAGGERIVRIKGIQPGTARIRFEYYKEWNPERVAKTKAFEVKVEEYRSQAGFDTPDELDAEYISAMDWKVDIFSCEEDFPPRFAIAKGQVQCKESSAGDALPSRLLERTIGSRKYCIAVSSEGAAGSVYKSYTYATVKQGHLVTVSLTARFSACGNYNEPKRSQCKREREKFDVDGVVDRVVQSMSFNSYERSRRLR